VAYHQKANVLKPDITAPSMTSLKPQISSVARNKEHSPTQSIDVLSHGGSVRSQRGPGVNPRNSSPIPVPQKSTHSSYDSDAMSSDPTTTESSLA
jgi:hypothetical protein